MAQVSVGQLQNLEDALSDITRAHESLIDACQALSALVMEKTAEAEEEEAVSVAGLESASAEEQRAATALEAAQRAREVAASALASAEAALSACEAQGRDEDGHPPDCSSEAGGVEAASAELAAAEDAVAHAEATFEDAKCHRMQMESRLDLARQARCMAHQLGDDVRTTSQARLHSVETLADSGLARLRQARAALEAYLDTNPDATQFAAWLRWSPADNARITPRELSARLNLSAPLQRHLLTYLADRDSAFQRKLEGYRQELSACRGAAEVHAVQLKVRRNLAGEVAERFTIEAYRSLAGNVKTQVRTDLPGDGYTKTDVVLEKLKVPVILGRGEGMCAGEGECIAIEIKCGGKDYLFQELDHMVLQSAGHAGAAAAMTLCSRDIKDLPPEQEERLRNALRTAGSPLVGMLPRKEEIDAGCWAAVARPYEQEGGRA